MGNFAQPTDIGGGGDGLRWLDSTWRHSEELIGPHLENVDKLAGRRVPHLQHVRVDGRYHEAVVEAPADHRHLQLVSVAFLQGAANGI